MDSNSLLKVEQLRGFQTLKVNPFFRNLMEAAEAERLALENQLKEPVSMETVYEHFRSRGKVEALERLIELLDQTISGLEAEIKEEQTAREREAQQTNQEGQQDVSDE